MNGFGDRSRNRRSTILLIVFIPGFIFFMGALPLYIGVTEIISARASRNWPSVDGTVIQSKVRVTESRGRDSSGKSTRELDYEADIRYRYSPGGKPALTGDRVNFGGVTNRAIAEREVKKYPVDATVKVYYDPGDPEKSVLEPGYSGGNLFLPILGTVVVGVAVLIGIGIWKFS